MAHKSNTRIKDIAEKAGCSIGTVDRVIHNRGRVSDAVRERILQIIKELNYKPNVNARVLASKHTLRLGILLPAFKKGEYWELPRQGIFEATERYQDQGYGIELSWFTYNNPEKFYQEGMKMISDDIDGIIMNPATTFIVLLNGIAVQQQTQAARMVHTPLIVRHFLTIWP